MLRHAPKREINKIFIFLVGFFSIFFIIGNVFAALPPTLAVSGRLADPNGNVLTGSQYNFTFLIYNVKTGGTSLWTEYHDGRAAASNVSVSKGVWSTLLGNNTTLNLAWNETYYLEMIINGETLAPRTDFSSVPFVLNRTVEDSGNYNFSGKINIKDGGTLNASLSANNITNVTFDLIPIFAGGLTSRGSLHVLNNAQFNATINAANITVGSLAAARLPTVFTTAHVFTGTNPTFTNGMIISGGTINLLNNTEFNATINAANITLGTLPEARIPSTLAANYILSGTNLFTGANPTFTNGVIVSGGTLNLLNNTAVNLTINAANITLGTLPEARIPSTLAANYILSGTNLFTGANPTFTNGVIISGGTINLLNNTKLNVSLSADNITNATFVNQLIVTTSSTSAFVVDAGAQTFLIADSTNRRLNINSSTTDALNISRAGVRIFDIDATSGSDLARFSTNVNFLRPLNLSLSADNITNRTFVGAVDIIADVANTLRVTDGSNQLFRADTSTEGVTINSSSADAFNVTRGATRIFDIDATTSGFARFSTSVNVSGALNITVPSLLVAGTNTKGDLTKFGNVSKNVPLFWNETTAGPNNYTGVTFNSSTLIQTGSGVITCADSATGHSVTLSTGYTNAATYNVFISEPASGGVPLRSWTFSRTNGVTFAVFCNATSAVNGVNFNWFTIGY